MNPRSNTDEHLLGEPTRAQRGASARGWLHLPRSLGSKLIGVVLLTTLAALTVALGAMVAYDVQVYHRTWLADMGTQAELIGQTTAPALVFDDRKVARENLALLRYRPQVRAAAVYRASGEMFASYATEPRGRVFPALPEADGVRVEGRDVVVFKRVVSGAEILGSVYLRADYELYDRIENYAGIAFAVAMVAMLVAWLLSSWLNRIVTRPLLSVASVAREVVQQKNYSRRAERLSDDEVGTLVDSFNGMLAEVEQRTAETERLLRETAVEVVERRAAQQEVMRLNTGLEQRVRDRTAQLESSNRDLALATAAAERANRAKSEFISSMSHELRTPLNAILGFGYLLQTQGEVLPAAKRAEFMQHIVKAGRHLLSLIDEILDLARIESSNMMLSLEPVEPADVLAECSTMLAAAAERRAVRMLFPSGRCGGVIADRTRLKQVLLNLLSNAVKYNREAGSVVVDCRVADAGMRRIAVQDTGLGLDAEQRAALFQPFNRLGQEGGAVEGTGIGLVVTKRLVELMGGRIGVDSTPGVGSVFWIELRAHNEPEVVALPAPAPETAARARPAAAEAERPLLIYVEDNPANLRLVEEIVALRGDLRQMSARDAPSGIALARAHGPAVILMDINLPGLSGEDALAALRTDPATAHVPVVALTANAMERDKARGLAAGFFRYVTKPIEHDALNEAIDGALAAFLSAEHAERPAHGPKPGQGSGSAPPA